MIFLKLCCLVLAYFFWCIANASAQLNESMYTLLPTETCGRTRLDDMKPRIIDGEVAAIGQFPWMARLGRVMFHMPRFVCGGTLISRYYVLTAAHCGTVSNMVRVGDHYGGVPKEACDESACSPLPQDIKIKHYIINDYNEQNYKNDIALVVLQSPVQFNDYVKPACLPHPSLLQKDLIDSSVSIAGWGVVDPKTLEQPKELMYIVAPIIENVNCDSIYRFQLTESQLCVGYDHGKDSCIGDSGGPITKSFRVNGERQTYVVGIVSYGLKNCGMGPAVYTNVMYHMEWILSNIDLA